jgi:hypothetical protein
MSRSTASPASPASSAPHDAVGFAASEPSGFGTTTSPGAGDARSGAGRGGRYRQRRHALAPVREYRIGPHALRWHEAGPAGPAGRGGAGGQLAYAQIACLRLQALPGAGGRRCRLTLQPRQGAAIVIDSDSAEGWFGRRSQAEGFRRFVRTLHATATQVQPSLRVEAAPAPPLGGLGPGLLAFTAAAALGLAQGPGWALAALLLSWPLAAWIGRSWQARQARPLPRAALPRHLLP